MPGFTQQWYFANLHSGIAIRMGGAVDPVDPDWEWSRIREARGVVTWDENLQLTYLKFYTPQELQDFWEVSIGSLV